MAKKKKRKKASKKRRKTTAHHHRAHRKAGTSYASKAAEWISANSIMSGAKKRKRKGGKKTWTCTGPVRSGCGGSRSKVKR